MQTFEERYTAWIDGKLVGAELEMFERELDSTGLAEAEADRESAHRLGRLLRRHSIAPPLTSRDFFNHQLFNRIKEAEAPKSAAHETPAQSTFAWSLPHLAWAAAFCLLLTFTFYRSSHQAGLENAPIGALSPLELVSDLDPTFAARTDDPTIFATAVRAEKEGMAVVWLDGLEYLPASYQLQ